MTDYIAEVELRFVPSDDSFQINVRCVDDEDGSALNGASVSITGPVEQTRESSAGYAVFEDVPRGEYTIRGSLGGYETPDATLPADEFVEQ